VLYSPMTDQEQPDKTGNEPAPLVLAAIAVVPLLAVVGWLVRLMSLGNVTLPGSPMLCACFKKYSRLPNAFATYWSLVNSIIAGERFGSWPCAWSIGHVRGALVMWPVEQRMSACPAKTRHLFGGSEEFSEDVEFPLL
jgi:hypothetical protein